MPANTPSGFSYPLYTDPIAGLQGYIQDLAEDMDAAVDALVARLDAAQHRPAAKLSGLANQALSPLADTTVTFSAADFDTGGMTNVGVSPTRIQLLEQGIYVIGASAAVTASGGTWGLNASLTSSSGFGGGMVSLRGSSTTLDPTTTTTYVNPSAITYTTGAVPVDITLVLRQSSLSLIQIQDRSLWAFKISNLPGGY